MRFFWNRNLSFNSSQAINHSNISKASRDKPGLIQRLGRTTLVLAVAATLFVPPSPPTAAATSPAIRLISEEPITAGAVMKSYLWSTVRAGQPVSVQAKVIQVDLHNPYVELDVMTGTEGQFTRRQTILGMARETGAVAAINGDFYNTQYEGVPVGPQIANGELMATPPYLPGFYTFAITKDRKPVVEMFTFDTNSRIIAANGASYTLGGINKTAYWYEPSNQHSMIDGLYMYTNAWGQIYRANDGVTNPTEVLVVDGVVVEIAPYKVIQMIAPENGYILRAAGKATEFVLENLEVGDVITAEYDVLPLDPSIHYDYRDFQMMIGGHTIMVDQGKPATYSRGVSDLAGFRARTAVGYSQDQRYVYLITADNNGDSKGLSMSELQDLMIKVGVWKGINLDGGGSTQMVARPLGETAATLVNSPETGFQRSVVNGLGVYTSAPEGALAGMMINGSQLLFIGEQASYSLKGYNEYYNPVMEADMGAIWTATSHLQQTGEKSFRAMEKGQAVLTVEAGGIKQTHQIEVVGSEEIARLEIQALPSILRAGEVTSLKATVTSKSGVRREIPFEMLEWEIYGFNGAITDAGLRVDSVEGAEQGLIIGRYDGFSSITALTVAETTTFADFDQQSYRLDFEHTAGVTGDVYVASDHAYNGGSFARLEYDFTNGSGTKAAYAVIEEKTAVIPGAPQVMEIDVNGDGSGNWLRAEFIDANGDVKRVDLARTVNWSGWRTLSADLSGQQMAYPAKLTRIYVANVDQEQDERSVSGQIDLDNIRFQYRSSAPVPPRNQVVLTIDEPVIKLNGVEQLIEQAPVIVGDYTLVPLRFVVEALEGVVHWNDAERKVTIVRGEQMMEFRLGQVDYIADGVRKTSDVAAELLGERTMVPVRVLTEHLGWTVEWDGIARTVTLE